MNSLFPRIKFASIFLLVALLSCFPAWAQKDTSPHSEAALVAETKSIQPGTPFTVALRIRMEPKWHSYWINPGDSGLPTKINWQLPGGWKAGEIQWPYPHKISTPPLMTYGYENDVWLLTKITPPKNLPQKPVTLRAKADWLICQDSCLPAKADLKLVLPVENSAPSLDARWSAAFAKTRQEFPTAKSDWIISAEKAAKGNGVVLHFTPPAGNETESAWAENDTYFFASDASIVEHAAPQKISKVGDGFRVELAPSEYSRGAPKQLRGVLLAPAGKAWNAAGNRAMQVDVPVGKANSLASTPLAAKTTSGTSTTLPIALLLALGGGLLLNLMPCVFPVLSLKILGFVQQSGEDKSQIKKHGFAFGAGVLLSFWTLAGALLIVRAAGGDAAWGFQFQSPVFVAGLVILLFAIGLNLLGAFEIGVSLTRVSAPKNSHGGLSGSFWSGVLATVVATPCTAPFMGAALGFALAQPAAVALLVFTFLGVGMATPYVVLSLNPELIKKLPRPGAWMETFKQLMAFPIFITALWLLWVFGLQTGVEGMTFLLGALLFLSAAIWIYRRGQSTPARAGALVFAGLAFALAWNGAGFQPVEAVSSATKSGANQIAWEAYSDEKVKSSLAAGRPIFIDFTAAWCITCQVNKRTTLRRPEVMDALAKSNVVLLSADWTRQDETITKALESYGRNGVPTYVLLAPGEVKPEILPEVLSPSIVMGALEKLPPRLAEKP